MPHDFSFLIGSNMYPVPGRFHIQFRNVRGTRGEVPENVEFPKSQKRERLGNFGMKTEWNGNFDVFPGKNWKSRVNLRTKISKADNTV